MRLRLHLSGFTTEVTKNDLEDTESNRRSSPDERELAAL